MKKQVLCQVDLKGRIINIYKSPEQASIDDRNRFDPHEIRIALESHVPYRGFDWLWMDYDIAKTIMKQQKKNSKTFTQGHLNSSTI